MIIGSDIPFIFQNCSFKLVNALGIHIDGNIYNEKHYEFKGYNKVFNMAFGQKQLVMEILLQECNVIDGIDVEVEEIPLIESIENTESAINNVGDNTLNNTNNVSEDTHNE